MAKKVAKKGAKVPMKTAGKTTTGVISNYAGYKGPKTSMSEAAPAMKKGGSVKAKKK